MNQNTPPMNTEREKLHLSNPPTLREMLNVMLNAAYRQGIKPGALDFIEKQVMVWHQAELTRRVEEFADEVKTQIAAVLDDNHHKLCGNGSVWNEVEDAINALVEEIQAIREGLK